MEALITTKVPVKLRFHNKGLSLTALSGVPETFGLSSVIPAKMVLSEKKSTYTEAMHHLQELLLCQKQGEEN